jgi:predicted DNA-binding protein
MKGQTKGVNLRLTIEAISRLGMLKQKTGRKPGEILSDLIMTASEEMNHGVSDPILETLNQISEKLDILIEKQE